MTDARVNVLATVIALGGTHQLLLENQIPNLALPACDRLSEICVEFPRTYGICGTLADL